MTMCIAPAHSWQAGDEVGPVAAGGVQDGQAHFHLALQVGGLVLPQSGMYSPPPKEFFLSAAGLASWLEIAAVGRTAGFIADNNMLVLHIVDGRKYLIHTNLLIRSILLHGVLYTWMQTNSVLVHGVMS